MLKKKVFSPFKERLQTRRLTSGTTRRETRRPEPAKSQQDSIVLARAA